MTRKAFLEKVACGVGSPELIWAEKVLALKIGRVEAAVAAILALRDLDLNMDDLNMDKAMAVVDTAFANPQEEPQEWGDDPECGGSTPSL